MVTKPLRFRRRRSLRAAGFVASLPWLGATSAILLRASPWHPEAAMLEADA